MILLSLGFLVLACILPVVGIASLILLWNVYHTDLENKQNNEESILVYGFTAISLILLGLTSVGVLILLDLGQITIILLSR